MQGGVHRPRSGPAGHHRCLYPNLLVIINVHHLCVVMRGDLHTCLVALVRATLGLRFATDLHPLTEAGRVEHMSAQQAFHWVRAKLRQS